MSIKRKDLGKRRGGIFSRLTNWVAGEKPPAIQDAINKYGPTVTSLPPSYDETPLAGDTVVDGKHCRTVGEVKAANLRKYGPDGYGP